VNFGIESETLEFKKTTAEIPDSLKDISAILNKHGRGELYFGIKNDGTVVGQMISGSSLRDVSQAISDKIKPQIYPTVEPVNIDNKNCIHVLFEGNDLPYFADGRAYLRVADENKQMSPAELEKYFKKKTGQASPWDSAPSGYAAEDVNTNYLRSYMKKANESGRLDYKFTDRDDILRRLDLLVGGEPNNTAIAMFGKKPPLEIQMAIFATEVKHTFIDIDRASGTIPDLVDLGERYIRQNIRWRVVRDGSPERTEIPEVPMDAVREALLNSYAHRDAHIPQTNEIAIFSNRIEIYNPGTFPEGMMPDDFVDGSEKSIHRNPLLARILYFSKDIESFGTGLRKIVLECEGAGVGYEFRLGKVGFTVVFYRPGISAADDPNRDPNHDPNHDPNRDPNNPIRDRNICLDMDDNDKGYAAKIISVIKSAPKATYAKIAKEIGVSDATVKRELGKLKEAGIIKREGSTRGSWVIRHETNGDGSFA
jgi:ATP-dependent DNA helicase RecG